ncbi:sensor histidine kinase [Rothia uropygioeca]|uniref:sensor histidine kinase n=1 Tax=Kocuria sp. 257 TaxID=2021970 RepID=UPI0010105D7A|nr:histidine kinase [Kocuria sp. 257]
MYPESHRSPPARIVAVGLMGSAWVFILVLQIARGDQVFPASLGIVALALWILQVALTRRASRTFVWLAWVMIVLGAFAGPATSVIGAIPAISGMLVLTRDSQIPIKRGTAGLCLGILGLALGALGDKADVVSSIGCLAGLLLVFLFGLLRRQSDAVEAAERASLEDRLAAAQERARSAAVEERTAIARDLHDVLAHSLGGLTIQLDALSAELESGKYEAAIARSVQARTLASSGLEEARRAVAALREPMADLDHGIESNIKAHRDMGGSVTVDLEPTQDLSSQANEVFSRGLQEFLTNARRYAPGETAHVRLARDDAHYRLSVSTPRTLRVQTSTGGGFGLQGVRERAEAIGGRLTIDEGNPFVATVEVPHD